MIPGVCRDERIVFFIAGHIAEVILDPERANIENSMDDFDRAIELLGTDDRQEILDRIKPLINKAISIVLNHRTEIEAVAQVLLREPSKTLTRGDIRRALG
jgi:hypothetical protein